ncbi:hypothetical protein ABW19_dt0209344 [Dactylella cylindrospora]|nr:hypothetical protein ABW19_dt0209344 [Dactylella cylindrospora]
MLGSIANWPQLIKQIFARQVPSLVPMNAKYWSDSGLAIKNWKLWDLAESCSQRGLLRHFALPAVCLGGALKPGGYLEILEPSSLVLCDDGSLPEDSALIQWNKLFISAADKAGRSVVEVDSYKDYLIDAGFPPGAIHDEVFKLPNAPWPKDKWLKEAGKYHMATFMEGLEGLSLRLFTIFHEMSPEEIQVLLVDVRKDLRNKAYHTYFNL